MLSDFLKPLQQCIDACKVKPEPLPRFKKLGAAVNALELRFALGGNKLISEERLSELYRQFRFEGVINTEDDDELAVLSRLMFCGLDSERKAFYSEPRRWKTLYDKLHERGDKRLLETFLTAYARSSAAAEFAGEAVYGVLQDIAGPKIIGMFSAKELLSSDAAQTITRRLPPSGSVFDAVPRMTAGFFLSEDPFTFSVYQEKLKDIASKLTEADSGDRSIEPILGAVAADFFNPDGQIRSQDIIKTGILAVLSPFAAKGGRVPTKSNQTAFDGMIKKVVSGLNDRMLRDYVTDTYADCLKFWTRIGSAYDAFVLADRLMEAAYKYDEGYGWSRRQAFWTRYIDSGRINRIKFFTQNRLLNSARAIASRDGLHADIGSFNTAAPSTATLIMQIDDDIIAIEQSRGSIRLGKLSDLQYTDFWRSTLSPDDIKYFGEGFPHSGSWESQIADWIRRNTGRRDP